MWVPRYKYNKPLNTQIPINEIGKNMGKFYETFMWGRFYKTNNQYKDI